MMMERAKIAKQAEFDGLCGIYCLVNAVRNWNEEFFDPEDADSLRYMLEAADRLGLFTVHRVMKGFEPHELIDIFNEFARAHRFPGKALHLSSMAEALNKWKFSCQAKRVFEQSGQIVIPVDKDDHWVLAYRHDYDQPGVFVEDSDGTNERPRIEYSDVRHKGRVGVLLLPADCTISFPE